MRRLVGRLSAGLRSPGDRRSYVLHVLPERRRELELYRVLRSAGRPVLLYGSRGLRLVLPRRNLSFRSLRVIVTRQELDDREKYDANRNLLETASAAV